MTDTNYKELVSVDGRFGPDDFTVLAFPCNQFGSQEPGDAPEILSFVQKYDATFPMFEKVDVNGANTHPLFKFLKSKKPELLGSDIKWNFAKFLIGRDGEVLERYPPTTSPESIAPDIEKALQGSFKGVVAPTSRIKLPFMS